MIPVTALARPFLSLPGRFSRYLTTRTMATTTNGIRDSCTQSNYNLWKTKHILAELTISFKEQEVHGHVTLDIESASANESEEIILDTNKLMISGVTCGGEPLKWNFRPEHAIYGAPLAISIPGGKALGEMVKIKIGLATTADCRAVQFLSPAQTKSDQPFMFSQCESILARTIIPCQDTPDIKSTYSFKIRSPLPVVTSGVPKGGDIDFSTKGTETLYEAEQSVPIPSYLFALASGDLMTAKVGPRSMVASSPDLIKACQWEFESDTEKFLQTAEKLTKVPYIWGQYNVLILPPSFPFGGMEHPIFTFATPALVSGDRQNVDVVAHEISHSWSGNLVTNAGWEHFWLNEGWTIYLERRIQGVLHGRPYEDFSALIGWAELEKDVKNYAERDMDHFTKLVLDMKDRDPEDAFSRVPYEKGFCFLRLLEHTVTRGKWDKFIPYYIKKWEKKSLDSYEFKQTVMEFFESDEKASTALKQVDWDSWYFKTGLPPRPDFDTSVADECYALAEKWKTETFTPAASDIEKLNANQIVIFLDAISAFKEPLSAERTNLLGKVYSFNTSKNIEITSRYYELGLYAKDKSVYEPAVELLGNIGRMKYVRPLYKALYAADKELAEKTRERHWDFYHPVCKQVVKSDFEKYREKIDLEWTEKDTVLVSDKDLA